MNREERAVYRLQCVSARSTPLRPAHTILTHHPPAPTNPEDASNLHTHTSITLHIHPSIPALAALPVGQRRLRAIVQV